MYLLNPSANGGDVTKWNTGGLNSDFLSLKLVA